MKRGLKVFMYVLVVLMLISFAMKFDVIAGPVAKAIGKPIYWVQDIATMVLFVGIGLFMISVGGPIAATLLGGALIVLGLGLVAAGLWSYFKKPSQPEL